MRARSNELRPDGKSVGKPRAGRGKIEAPGLLCSEAILHQAGGCRKQHIRRDAREDDEIDVGGIRFGLREEGPGGFGRKMRGCHAIFHHVALADAGALADPGVVGRDHFLEVGVGHHLGRNVAGDTRNFCRDAMRHNSPW